MLRYPALAPGAPSGSPSGVVTTDTDRLRSSTRSCARNCGATLPTTALQAMTCGCGSLGRESREAGRNGSVGGRAPRQTCPEIGLPGSYSGTASRRPERALYLCSKTVTGGTGCMNRTRPGLRGSRVGNLRLYPEIICQRGKTPLQAAACRGMPL
jgi:hypothetical protein